MFFAVPNTRQTRRTISAGVSRKRSSSGSKPVRTRFVRPAVWRANSTGHHRVNSVSDIITTVVTILLVQEAVDSSWT